MYHFYHLPFYHPHLKKINFLPTPDSTRSIHCDFEKQSGKKKHMYSLEIHIMYITSINILAPRVKTSNRQTKFQRCLVYSDVEQIKIRPGLSLQWAHYGLFCLTSSLFWKKASFCIFLLGGVKKKVRNCVWHNLTFYDMELPIIFLSACPIYMLVLCQTGLNQLKNKQKTILFCF